MYTQPVRVGLIGFGKTGQYLYDQLTTGDKAAPSIEIAFVHNRTADALHPVPDGLRLHDLADLPARIHATGASVVVEASHPSVTLNHAEAILSRCNYLPMSLTALANAKLLHRLTATAKAAGTSLCISHGAVTALDTLHECRDLWESVTVTMIKPPSSLDFDVSGMKAPTDLSPTVLYDGPSCGVCPLFPRNTNVHAAVALAGIGFDRTRSILIADASTTESRLELKAEGPGVSLHIIRTNELKGVSGVMTLRAALGSLRTVTATKQPVVFC